MNKHIVAVYGSLRKELHNHRVLLNENTEFLGEFKTPPIYSMYSIGYFPGLKEDGDTSIVMEVYKVDSVIAKSIDRLEGYSENEIPTFYDKKEIETPFGKASVYIYIPEASHLKKVESGDWKQFFNKL